MVRLIIFKRADLIARHGTLQVCKFLYQLGIPRFLFLLHERVIDQILQIFPILKDGRICLFFS